MYVFPETVVTWQGVDYTCKATFDLINSIENKVSLGRLISRVADNDIPLSHLSLVLGTLLRAAGCRVSDIEVHGELMQLGDEDGAQLQLDAINTLAACFPSHAPKGKKKAAG